jgi:hypothetical protein
LQELDLPPSPTLAIEQNQSAGTVTISWPVSSYPFQVFASDNLATPQANWTLVTGYAATTNNGRVCFTVPVNTQHNYFQVRNP